MLTRTQFGFLLRCATFFIIETLFRIMDLKKGAKDRRNAVKELRE